MEEDNAFEFQMQQVRDQPKLNLGFVEGIIPLRACGGGSHCWN